MSDSDSLYRALVGAIADSPHAMALSSAASACSNTNATDIDFEMISQGMSTRTVADSPGLEFKAQPVHVQAVRTPQSLLLQVKQKALTCIAISLQLTLLQDPCQWSLSEGACSFDVFWVCLIAMGTNAADALQIT